MAAIPGPGRANEVLLFAPVKVLPNLSQTRLLPYQAAFARAVLILE